jgi:uncharacterized protein (DUF1501 family)
LDERGNLPFTTDFRRLYAAIAQDLFGANPRAVVGSDFAPLDCLKS